MTEQRRARWEARAEWPLTVLAVAFLVTYALPVLRPGLPAPAVALCETVQWAIWGLFVVDYAVRWWISEQRRRFVRSNALDLLVIALPLLRPLRILRLLPLLGILNRRAAGSLRGRVTAYVVAATVLVLFCSALAVLDTERGNPDANITSFGDALWWAVTTVTTVGYGDLYPTTTTGRVIAALLMLGGIALLGIVTAGLASWLLDRIREVEEESAAATRSDVNRLSAEIDRLREEIRRLGTEAGPPPADARQGSPGAAT